MPKAARFSFATSEFGGVKDASFLPMLALTIVNENRSIAASGLVDSGSTVNVLPYQVGLELGLVWEKQPASFRLSGNLAQYDARPIVLSVLIDKFKPVRLAFAWTKAESVPLILGQVNFFMEFDVCFFRSRKVFEIKRKKK